MSVTDMTFRYSYGFSSRDYFIVPEICILTYIHESMPVCRPIVCIQTYIHLHNAYLYTFIHKIQIIIWVYIKLNNRHIHKFKEKMIIENGSLVFREKIIEKMIIVGKRLTYQKNMTESETISFFVNP